MTDGLGAGVDRYRLVDRREQFANRLFRLVTDRVRMPDGAVAERDYLQHTGAAAAVALDFPPEVPGGRVLLIGQYRHPTRQIMWELPAGLTDVAGESSAAAASRELAEETDRTAGRWDLLIELHTTPGCSDELIRVYLAREIGRVPSSQRYQRDDEEADLRTEWVALDDAVDMALAGTITNATCVAGVLAAARARDAGWSTLRPTDG